MGQKSKVKVPSEAYPDPEIVDMLCDLGFNSNALLDSLPENKYDEIMALYLILKQKARKGLDLGSTTSAKPVDAGPKPPSTPAHEGWKC